MYVRKRKNKSGSYSVMLCIGERRHGKKHPISRMIKSFGVAKDEEYLEKLLSEAEKYKKHLEATAPKARALRIDSDREVQSCRSRNVGFYDVYGNAFSSIFNTVKLKNNLFQKLKELAVMRVANPCSKRKTATIAEEYGFDLQIDSIYKYMDLITPAMISETKKTVYKHTQKLLAQKKQTIDVLFYDLTTIYFETNTQDELRDFGFSKDGKHQHVQIMLALIVTKEGLPIDYEEFPGNSYEGHTLLPVLHKIREKYQIDKTVIVADAALMNKINLQELDACGVEYIIAAKLKNENKELKQSVLNLSGYKTISKYNETEHGVCDHIQSKVIPSATDDYIFAYNSTKRARKDAYDREKDLEKIKKHINSTAKSNLTSRLKKSYVKISKGCKINIDYEKLELEAKFDGFFGLRTNIKDANPAEILLHYRGLWQIEQTFRISKFNLEIRSVFHYTTRRIRAHLLICYMALTLIRHVGFTLKANGIHMPPERLSMLLNSVRKVRIIDKDNNAFELLENTTEELISIYRALKIQLHKKFQYLSNL